MKQFERIGLFLGDEPGDDEALAFTGMFAELADSKLVLCIHVRGLEFSTVGPPPNERQVEDDIRRRLPPKVAERTVVEVHQETGLVELLRSARSKDLDLIIVGRRLPGDRMAVGSVFLRLARKSPCSVLVIPDKAKAHMNRALVLIDGSDHSKRALSTALAIVRAAPAGKPQVLAQSVYTVGYGYGYSGLSFSEAIANMEARTRERLQPILDEVDTSGVDFELVLSYSDHVSQAAYDLATARHMDFIVVGSRGTRLLPASLLGGVGEQIVAGSPAPVLVVKKKGETVRFLDVLLSGE